MSGCFYRGTTTEQDGRFSDKERKLIRSQQWPEEFNTRVDIKKVNIPVIKSWVEKKLEEIAELSDEVVTNFVISEIEEADEKGPNPKKLQINLEGFLHGNTREFVIELWRVLLQAQDSKDGIPEFIVDNTKSEMDLKRQKLEEEMERIKRVKEQIMMASSVQNNVAKAEFEEDKQKGRDERENRRESKPDRSRHRDKRDRRSRRRSPSNSPRRNRHKRSKRDHRRSSTDSIKHKKDHKKRDRSLDKSKKGSTPLPAVTSDSTKKKVTLKPRHSSSSRSSSSSSSLSSR